jgi:hypothetical protein
MDSRLRGNDGGGVPVEAERPRRMVDPTPGEPGASATGGISIHTRINRKPGVTIQSHCQSWWKMLAERGNEELLAAKGMESESD